MRPSCMSNTRRKRQVCNDVCAFSLYAWCKWLIFAKVCSLASRGGVDPLKPLAAQVSRPKHPNGESCPPSVDSGMPVLLEGTGSACGGERPRSKHSYSPCTRPTLNGLRACTRSCEPHGTMRLQSFLSPLAQLSLQVLGFCIVSAWIRGA
jgi:hypothetical protein